MHMQRGRVMRTHLVNTGSCLDQLTDNHILSIVTSQMEWCVAIGISLIYLCTEEQHFQFNHY